MQLPADIVYQIEMAAKKYPTPRSAIMPSLYLAQSRYDYLTSDVLKNIAEILDIPEIWVFELATFYTMYHTEAVGKYHIQLCTNVSCLLCKADVIKTYLEKRLQIKSGETTADGRFSLSMVECLGSCDKAPALMVNQQYHEYLDETRIGEILDHLMEKSEA